MPAKPKIVVRGTLVTATDANYSEFTSGFRDTLTLFGLQAEWLCCLYLREGGCKSETDYGGNGMCVAAVERDSATHSATVSFYRKHYYPGIPYYLVGAHEALHVLLSDFCFGSWDTYTASGKSKMPRHFDSDASSRHLDILEHRLLNRLLTVIAPILEQKRKKG